MPEYLRSTAWLAEHLNDENIRIIDIRGRVVPASEPPPHYFSHRDDYEKSHIPGALFVDWMTDIIEPGSASNDVASPERYAALMSRLGIGDETQVIVYDDARSMFAARFWWSLRYYGHENISVLDGGWQKWLAENHPVTDEIPNVEPANFTPRPNAILNRNADDILQKPEKALLWDIRSAKEFNGEASRAERKGHIPGALNLSRKQLLTDEGCLPDTDDLQERFAAANIDLNAPEIIIYCNSGVSASFGLLALEQAGYTGKAAVYDGSWKDWGNDPSKPID